MSFLWTGYLRLLCKGSQVPVYLAVGSPLNIASSKWGKSAWSPADPSLSVGNAARQALKSSQVLSSSWRHLPATVEMDTLISSCKPDVSNQPRPQGVSIQGHPPEKASLLGPGEPAFAFLEAASGHSCCRLAPQIYHYLGFPGAKALYSPQAVQCLILWEFLPPHSLLPPPALEILLTTQMGLKSSLSEPLCGPLASFSCVKLRYKVGEVWMEGPKFEKSRTGNLDPALARPHLLVGLSAGHSVEFSFLTWWKWWIGLTSPKLNSSESQNPMRY